MEYRPKEGACKGPEVGAGPFLQGMGALAPKARPGRGHTFQVGTLICPRGSRRGQPEKGQPRSLQRSLLPGSESPVDVQTSPGSSEGYGQQGIKDIFVEVVFESGRS